MKRSDTRTLTAGALSVSLLIVAACGEVPGDQPDDTWISFEGTVEDVMPGAIAVDYGEGSVMVEIDDGDRDADAYDLLPGYKVAVMGRVDDDFLETASIEASSVYVENLGTYFYGDPEDEEDTFVELTYPLEISRTVLQGTVTAVTEDAFLLDVGRRQITIEVDEMAYDPLDDEGYQRVEIGDHVSVTGEVDYEFFELGHLDAKTVTTLVDRSETT